MILVKKLEYTKMVQGSVIFFALFMILIGCTKNNVQQAVNIQETVNKQEAESDTTKTVENSSELLKQTKAENHEETVKRNEAGQQKKPEYAGLSQEDILTIKPDESGKIMVVMFHNFEKTISDVSGYNGEYSTTLDAFRTLLKTLYDMDYRLISMADYLNGEINVEAGKIPMLFTFDDATSGQFNLVKQGGKWVSDPQTAVGIMEEFSKTYPDFGTKGVFYVNLANSVFEGGGTIKDRFTYLLDKGFEIGTHGATHLNLRENGDATSIQRELGGNQKRMEAILPGFMFESYALAFGARPRENQEFLAKGSYEGVRYENKAIMEVGWQPTYSPFHKDLDPLRLNRVRASGMKPVDTDLAWWLDKLSRKEQYVSDGNPETVTIPKSREDVLSTQYLGERTLVTYEG